jgi:hypothetical protein
MVQDVQDTILYMCNSTVRLGVVVKVQKARCIHDTLPISPPPSPVDQSLLQHVFIVLA